MSATTSVSLTDTVSVGVDDLVIGRPLQHPICDDHGVLLLAEGSVITAEFRQKLQQRKSNTIRVHKNDQARITVNAEIFDGAGDVSLDTELTSKLDSVIDSGMLFVRNAGPAVKDDMVFHGRKAYDTERRENLIMQHQSASESIDSMMKDALKGGRGVDGRQVMQMAATYLTDLSEDADNVLTAAQQANQQGLSEHCLKTSLMAMAIAVEMELDADNVRTIGITGLVQDWGMTKIPKELLSREHRLSANEFVEIKKHPIYTLDILEGVSGMPRLVPLVAYQVHERPNGRGYPRGRSGNTIHLFARVIAVADMYTALTSPRPWRPRLTPYAAMELLLKRTQTRDVDADVVRALLRTVSLFPIGSLVTLSDGSVARVIRRNRDLYTTPIVQVIQKADGSTAEIDDPDMIIDLSDAEVSVVQSLPTPGRQEIRSAAEFEAMQD